MNSSRSGNTSNSPAPNPRADEQRPPPSVVGVGASAGGLTALKRFFERVPEDSGLRYVVVMHLSPKHESHLAELLQPHCSIPVVQVRESVKLEPNRVYVIPPNANLNSVDTHLRLSELEDKRRNRAPIDHFFRTLAETHDGHAIGVLLSGTGSDGTLGLRSIAESRGLTLAQAPEEAEYDGMIRSALAADTVDEVLPVGDIPAAILRFVRTEPHLPVTDDGENLMEDGNRRLHKIFDQVRSHTGHDFSKYKRSTVLRRVERRMQMHNLESLDDYLDHLRGNPGEVRRLFDDLLITVTEFFRDAKVFGHLENEVVPAILEGKDSEDSVRVWSVGCSTGEEPYSLAMLFTEAISRRDAKPRLQLFATDLQESALARAWEGVYPDTISEQVSRERLNRFFDKDNGSYRVKPELRERIVFAAHNILREPPFSRMDLIVCRNMLIYLQRDVQGDVASVLHYALKSSGYLVLGASESIDPSDLFVCENKPCSLYRRRDIPSSPARLPFFPQKHLPPTDEASREPDAARAPGFGSLHAEMVEQFAPPSVLVSQNHEVVHCSASAGRYLKLPGGEPTRNLFKLIDEPLRSELRAAMLAAAEQPGVSRSREIPLTTDGERRHLILRVRSSGEGPLSGYFLVMFDERREDGEDKAEEVGDASATSMELRTELDLARQRLQAVVEEYDTTREEMQASNEELQSTNEELRSTMEELETSKEELQSMNEELTTLNQENRHRVEDLKQLSGDLQNLLSATDIATIFLDRQLRIVRFTPKVGELFNVRNSDKGRPLSDLTHRLGESALHEDAARVLERLTPAKRELRSEDGRWYLSRILPYRTPDDHIQGVVLTLIDISERKKFEEQVQEARDFAEAIVESLPQPLVVLRPDLTVKTANAGFYDHFQADRDSTVGRKLYELGNRQWDIPALRKLLEEVLPENRAFYGYQVEHEFQSIGKRVMMVNARRLDTLQLILLGIQDITDRDTAQRMLALRTAKVEEQKLRLQHLTKELATAEHRERKRLAAMLHDELQQYLVAMKLHLGAARTENGGNGESLDKALEALKHAIGSSRDLTRQLRPPVLYEAGLIPALRWQAAEMNRLHEMEITVKGEVDHCPLDDDLRAMLFECVRELLFNVVKHAGVKEARMEVHFDDRILRMEIEDHGNGFEPETVRRHELEGGGMGLFSIRERMKASGGSMEIHSIPGDGTRITLAIPLKRSLEAEPAAEAGTVEELLEPAPRRRPGGAARVLVVDDHAVVRQGLVTLINTDPRIEVVGEAEDGVEAIEKVKRDHPDVVLMDVNMPRMNGLEATRRIRKRWPHVNVIGLSVQDDEATVQSSREAGAALFVSKSENAKTMIEAILTLADTGNG